MLTKDLLRVSRAGGGYRPRFADADDTAVADRVLDAYRDAVGAERATLTDALTALERDAPDFKLVRGFAKLVERDATFEVRAAVEPRTARNVAFAAAEDVGVVTEAERDAALADAAERLDETPDGVLRSLHADRESREVLAALDPRWDAEALVAQYNLSLAQTALFDATEVRVRTDDPRSLVLAIKRLGLLYEVRELEGGVGREVVLTGPDALFRRTRRYGTRFARVLRAVVGRETWRIEATVDDRGTERTMVLSDADPLRVPDADPVTDVSYDSGVEREFAARFDALDLDWDLVREPDLLDAGERLMVPDFAFDYRYADFRVYFEIMGFWTPEYVAKKLEQLDATDVELLVAVDESLGVGDEVETRDHRAIPYTGSVRVKDVVDALREFEAELETAASDDLPDELVPDADVVALDALAESYGVPVEAVESRTFPEHDLVGRTLVRPDVLDALREEVAAGMALDEAEARIEAHGLTETSAVLAALGYRVEWEGLGGGVVREKEA
ncbi:putative nuclease of restriction endonuclease-like RecB superfamily [Halarchaeum rubridurum]|uniref:Putative nuclease of restriction endonuclease-like RecB superfamily n=1 Tax=Halarchaeum rubridurum TaxID=489911 RepID=A0A830G1Z3_9EURY|nr:DUF790 family protein [Halarchaeum rubridurum]MBP1955351.1 putative nuclease of restriction endonuclease-like RecB superfamily [Halarchaeum rubridurum]GGM71705.1 translation initiation factor IF-2 [Halarchaeum rubridurum]